MKKIIFSGIITFALALLFALSANAQESTPVAPTTPASTTPSTTTPSTTTPATTTPTSSGFGVAVGIPDKDGNITKDFDDYEEWVEAFYQFSIRLGGILTILMLVYSGYRYMFSQGNPTAIKEALDILTGTLSGFAMLLLVYTILRFINIDAS